MPVFQRRRFLHLAMMMLLVALSTSCLQQALAEPLLVSPVAGNGFVGSTLGSGTNAQFSGISGLDYDSAGNFYIADNGNSRILKMAASTFEVTLEIEVYGVGAISIFRTTGDDQVYFARYGTVEVFPVSNSSNRRIVAGNFTNVGQILVTTDGSAIMMADRDAFCIRKMGTALSEQYALPATVAGSCGISSGMTDGVGTVARFVRPYGISHGPGYYYISDEGRIRRMADTAPYTVATIAVLSLSYGFDSIVYHPGRDSLFVGDQPLKEVSNISGDVVVTWYRLSERRFHSRVMIVDSTGTLFACPSAGNRIVSISPTVNGTYPPSPTNLKITQWIGPVDVTPIAGDGFRGSVLGSGTNAQFSMVTGLDYDDTGNFYIADSGSNRFLKMAVNSLEITVLFSGSGYYNLGAVSIFRTTGDDQVYLVQGSFLRTFSVANPFSVQMVGGNLSWAPGAIQVTTDGLAVIIADKEAYCIRKMSTANSGGPNQPEPLAGSCDTSSGVADGVGTVARFARPYGISHGPGYYYISDEGRIRRMADTAPYTVNTLISLESLGGQVLSVAYNSVTGTLLITSGALFELSNLTGSPVNLTFVPLYEPRFQSSPIVIAANGSSTFLVQSSTIISRVDMGLPAPTSGPNPTHLHIDTAPDYLNLLHVAGNGFEGSSVGPAASSQFSYIAGLDYDSAGNFYIADSGNHRIVKMAASTFDISEAYTARYHERIGSISIFRTSGGDDLVYFARSDTISVFPVSNSSDVRTVAGNFTRVGEILVTDDGLTVMMTDYQGYCIRKMSTALSDQYALPETVAGSCDTSSGVADGVGTVARFVRPYGISHGPGYYYISDEGRIRRMADTAPYTVVTLLDLTSFGGFNPALFFHPTRQTLFLSLGSDLFEAGNITLPGGTSVNVTVTAHQLSQVLEHGGFHAASMHAPNGKMYLVSPYDVWVTEFSAIVTTMNPQTDALTITPVDIIHAAPVNETTSTDDGTKHNGNNSSSVGTGSSSNSIGSFPLFIGIIVGIAFILMALFAGVHVFSRHRNSRRRRSPFDKEEDEAPVVITTRGVSDDRTLPSLAAQLL